MMKDLIKNILQDIRIREENKGSYCDFGSGLYQPFKLDKNNFHIVEEKQDTKTRIAFIDGGNNEIISSSHFSLHFIRIYATIYKDNKRAESWKYEFYCLASAAKKDDKIFYDVKTYPVNYDIDISSFDSFDKTLMTGNHRVNVSRICEAARKLAEIDIALKTAENLDKGDIIIMDGDLLASSTDEPEFSGKLYSKANERGVIVCGLSKTTQLFTDTGCSLVSALDKMAPKAEWYY